MKRKFSVTVSLLLTALIMLSTGVTALAKSGVDVTKARIDIAAIMLATVKNPVVGSVGGEWAVLGLARSDYDVSSSYYEGYYKTVEKYVKDKNGILDRNKYTEYSRVILALTAVGSDPRSVGGYDLTIPLGDFEKTIYQGINGPTFALIALDSAGYDVPKNPDAKTQATREMYIDEILSRQLNSGGFALGKTESAADPDITGMVLQALAKYQDRADVKAATEKALDCLSQLQSSNGGGFISWDDESSESIVQVIVALCELGIGVDDPRFVKNGNSLLDRLMDYYIPGKGFEHIIGDGMNQMATEQALYALAAVYRHENGLTSLYDMTDVGVISKLEKPSTPGLPGKHEDVKQMPITATGKTFADISGNAEKTAIEALASRGIINGKSENEFEPAATMTRAEFAAIVTRGLGLAEKPSAIINKSGDIPSDSWYAGFVGSAYYYGIVNGTSASEFTPDGTITRQEAATMIARAAKLCGMDTERNDAEIRDILAQFGDYRTAADWAREPLAFCFAEGILSQEEFNIEPECTVTRAEIAGMLFRMLDKSNLL